MLKPLNAATSEKRLTSASVVVLPQSKRVKDSSGADGVAAKAAPNPMLASTAAKLRFRRFIRTPLLFMWTGLFGFGAHVAPHERLHGRAHRLVLVHDCVYFAADRHLHL